jgi:VanZ family protein
MKREWRAAALVLTLLLVIVAVGLTPDGVRWIRTEVPLANFGMGWLELQSVGINATHVALFFAVGLVMACALLPGRRLWRAGLCSLVLLVVIALASEALQLGIPGRTARLVDVRDDLLGGAVGVLLGLCLRTLWRRWRLRRGA